MLRSEPELGEEFYFAHCAQYAQMQDLDVQVQVFHLARHIRQSQSSSTTFTRFF